MRLSILFAFGALLGASSAGNNENWGVPENGYSKPVDAVRQRSIAIGDALEDFETVHNREQWDILKTKQQKLRTGKVQIQALLKKREANSGRAYPDPDIIAAIDRVLNYRPTDPRLLDYVDHLPIGKKSSSRSSSLRLSSNGSPKYQVYGEPNEAYEEKSQYEPESSPDGSSGGNPKYQNGYGVSSQAYEDKPNAPHTSSTGTGNPKYQYGSGVSSQAYEDKSNTPSMSPSGTVSPKYQDSYGVSSQAYGDKPKAPYTSSTGTGNPKYQDSYGVSSQAYGDKPKASYTSSTGTGNPKYQDSYGVSSQAYGDKPNAPHTTSSGNPKYQYGSGVLNQAYGIKSNSPGYGSVYDDKRQSYGWYPTQSKQSTSSHYSKVPVAKTSADIYPPRSSLGTGSFYHQSAFSKAKAGVYSPGKQSYNAQDKYSKKPGAYDAVPNFSRPQGLEDTELVFY